MRSLASKVAFKTQEYDFIKKNVLPLTNTDKSKKVLRTISGKITRKDLIKKVASLAAKKTAPPPKAETEAAGVAPQKNRCFFLFFLLSLKAHAGWPEGPWLNGNPRDTAITSAVAFISPSDLQFLKIMNVWKALEKRYGPLNVDFLLIARGEPLLPFEVAPLLKDPDYQLSVFLDSSSRYAKLWRAYVSPTVYLVHQNGKVISFDPGNFDPAVFEKALQKCSRNRESSPSHPRIFK